MSAVLTTAAALLLYGIVLRHLPEARAVHRVLAGLAAGLCIGLSPLVWSQAVITEVYALQSFLVVLLIFLYTLKTPAKPSRRYALDGLRGLTLGLALGNHITVLLLVPLFLVVGSVRSDDPDRLPAVRRWLRGYHFSLASFGIQVLALAIGLSLYLILPMRAATQPPVNWGNPIFWSRFWWLVSGKLYQSYYLQADFSHLLEQARGWAQFIVLQLGLFGVFLGLLGLVVFGRVSRLFLLTVGIAIASLAFSFVYHPADASVYLTPLLISFSIWLGIGLGGLAELLSRRSPVLAMGASLLVIGFVLIHSLSFFSQVDASQDSTAEDFGREVLSRAPEDAILLAEGDRAIFVLWYFHFALHERPDLVVIARELVSYDWYRDVIRYTYPSLIMPGQIIYPETIVRFNSHRPICDVRYVDRTEMECGTE